jgi:hypothetical protein
MHRPAPIAVAVLSLLLLASSAARAEGDWEITPESEKALELGLEWLARNQGAEGHWKQQQMGLVSMGLLAYLSAGHLPGRGKYGRHAQQALDFIIKNAQPSGLLNTALRKNDMYNHGLTTFVLGQVYGMTGDRKVGEALDRALKLTQNAQCGDGGWDYVAESKPRGHDLSLCVMQAKALRGAMDCALKVEPSVIQKAVKHVKRYYCGPKKGTKMNAWRGGKAPFSYGTDHSRASLTLTAIGVVSLQEFGQYDDWRLEYCALYIRQMIKHGEKKWRKEYEGALPGTRHRYRHRKWTTYDKIPDHHVPFDAYTLYYLGQAIYQLGGDDWKFCYPILRDELVRRQKKAPGNTELHGCWTSMYWWMRGHQARFYGTAIGCFMLAIPNRYLPILQEGHIESLSAPAASP